MRAGTAFRHTNRLAREKSPYLLQHAHNPVDWYPWGEEAFAAARREGKPVFLSIGYSTCHWCHVMERESFEDEEVAAALNGGFVAIKVDREERPDIDKVYMEACAAMTGGGGWPLTILMTPDGKPFFAGTYLPKRSRDGMPGLLDLLGRVREAWRSDPASVARAGEDVAAALRGRPAIETGARREEEAIREGFEQLRRGFDRENGGFGRAPKFPSPHLLMFLLRYADAYGEKEALSMAVATLDAMARGGIRDQLAGGFHRYAVDAAWRVPHFEKMLYDQALLAAAYTEAYLATGDAAHERIARGALDDVLREMTSPEGGFFSAEDADSEGEEGRFYVWTPAEVKAVLGEEEGAFACRCYGVTEEGNVEGARSVLYGAVPPPAGGSREAALLERCRVRLLEARGRRVRPHRDEKILADWNGMMIAALAKAAAAFGEPRYAEAAGRAADFLRAKLLRPDGALLHRYGGGEAAVPAFLDDYAFLAWGLLELYEATFDPRALADALTLTRATIERFRDGERGGFFFSAAGAEELILKTREASDGAYPSGNAVAAWNMARLGRLTGETALEERAGETARAFAGEIAAAPAAHAQFLTMLLYARGPAREIVVAGAPEREETRAMLREARRRFMPAALVALHPPGAAGAEIGRLVTYLDGMTEIDGRPAVYVCTGSACAPPATGAEGLAALLDARPGGTATGRGRR